MTKISIVLCGKNDNYGGNFDSRLLLTLKYNLKEFKKRGIETEVIFVEWNPIAEEPLLSSVLVEEIKNIQCYVVNNETHSRLAGKYDYMTFLEFFAKNVGIRRATGDYIICTNADVFYAQEVFDFIAEGNLEPHIIYRAERSDLRFNNLKGLGDKKFQEATFRTNPVHMRPYTDASGDFTFASKELFMKVNGYDENMRFVKIHKDSRILFTALYDDEIDFKLLGTIYHIDHVGSAVGTSGTLAGYRPTNGPYHWKYIKNLPYVNRPFWGMADEIVDKISIGEKITRLQFKSGFNMKEYQFDDAEYEITHDEDLRPYIEEFRTFEREKLGIASGRDC